MRQRDFLSPEEERELDALDRALAGDPVDADLRELEDLVNDIRATAPQMSPGFAASLEHRVAEGFPATDEHPAPRSPRRWILFPAAGALCAALVALVVVLGSGGHDDAGTVARENAPIATSGDSSGSASSDTGVEPAPAPRASAPAGSGAASKAAPGGASSTAVAPAPPPAQLSRDRAVAPASGPRKVQRSADLVLRVSNGKVESTADGVIRTVDRFGGIVASSQIASEGRHGEASFDLRIPTERLDDALAALSKLGHVAQRNQSLTDITGSFTSAQDRLSDARAERRGLLKALGRASTKQQVDSLRARLRNVRSQIARLNGDLAALRRRADLSTVSVTVRGSDAATAADPDSGGSWSPGDAARDAVRVLEVIAGVLLIALAIAAPLAILALIGAVGVRSTRRRRRESALDPA
jgi:Domain of unknown function (DUF4349)